LLRIQCECTLFCGVTHETSYKLNLLWCLAAISLPIGLKCRPPPRKLLVAQGASFRAVSLIAENALLRSIRHRNALLFVALVQSATIVCAQTSGTTTVYKHVDEQGRVTYSNAPVKGSTQVDLQPLTVVRSAQSNAPTTQQRAAVVTPQASEAPVSPMTSGERVPVPSFEQPAKANQLRADPRVQSNENPLPTAAAQSEAARPNMAASKEAAPAGLSSSVASAAAARQRRDDVRRRIIEGELEAETQMLGDARLELQREQSKSPAMRSLRAALTSDAASSRSPEKQVDQDTIIAKSLVERHFARIRDLQDLIAVHEANIAELRALVPAQSKAPVAKVVATRSLAMQR
jgi:hypothetical protein